MCTSSRLLLGLAIAQSAFGTLGCSGGEASRPPEDLEYTKIDDMEGTSGRIEWTPEMALPDALPGRWITYADVQCADLSPIPEWAPGGAWSYAPLPEPHETRPGVTSQTAARVRTTAVLVNTWGAGMSFMFSEPPTGSTLVTRPCTQGAARVDYPAAPVDLRRYSGIAFWGRAAQDTANATVLVQFQDANTDPRGGICDPMPESARACYNGFGVELTLGAAFEHYVVAFDELAQNPNWGVDRPELTFDVWIDDLYFVKR
jgi:hypothetical protein